jgi:hypothetical protein
MVAVMRCIHSNRITAVHRTRLSDAGEKVERRILGVAAGSAVKLDPDESVSMGITVGEGIETCLAARQLGFKPVWALGSAGAIRTFPVLSGLDCVTLLSESGDGGANEIAVRACSGRWHAAAREVLVVCPKGGGDVNDALLRVRV